MDFIRVPAEELQWLVQRIDISAEFTLTAMAERYYRGQHITRVPTCTDDDTDEYEHDEE